MVQGLTGGGWDGSIGDDVVLGATEVLVVVTDGVGVAAAESAGALVAVVEGSSPMGNKAEE